VNDPHPDQRSNINKMQGERIVIGYRVTAKCTKMNYIRTYSGWSEGSPKLESKAKETAAKAVVKQVMKQGAKFIVGAAAGSVVKVADIVSKPLQGMGAAAGQLIAENLLKINRIKAEQGLDVTDLVVTLTGDFEGNYRVNDRKDLEELPKMLALIPEKGTTSTFMGDGVLESSLMAHINFARWLFNSGKWNVSNQTVYNLELNIDL